MARSICPPIEKPFHPLVGALLKGRRGDYCEFGGWLARLKVVRSTVPGR